SRHELRPTMAATSKFERKDSYWIGATRSSRTSLAGPGHGNLPRELVREHARRGNTDTRPDRVDHYQPALRASTARARRGVARSGNHHLARLRHRPRLGVAVHDDARECPTRGTGR